MNGQMGMIATVGRDLHAMKGLATMRGRTDARGFTLIELMVTVSVLAIILSIAVPSFQSIINGNRLTGAVNEAAAIVQSARMEALRRNQRVSVCPTVDPNAATVDCVTTGARGLVSFVEGGAVLARYTLPPSVQASFSTSFGSRLTFRPDGFARTAAGALVAGQMQVCIPTTRPRENIRVLGVESGSRITTERKDGNGSC